LLVDRSCGRQSGPLLAVSSLINKQAFRQLFNR
jgi:hypothetical protein